MPGQVDLQRRNAYLSVVVRERRRGLSQNTRRPTIHEVARVAGVSIGTVSNVLNGTAVVRPELRVQVEQAITTLGYRPNTIARMLIARRARESGLRISAGPKLTSVGYLSVDYTARVDALPRRDDRLTAAGIEKSLGGPAANVAVMAASLGGRWAVACELVTALGNDTDSEWALSQLAARSVETIAIRGGLDRRLSRCIILVEPDGRRTIVNEPFVLEETNVVRYLDHAPEDGKCHCVHFDGYQVTTMADSIPRVHDLGFITSVHTTGLPQDWRTPEAFRHLRAGFDLVFVNRDVARDILQFSGSDSEIVRRVQRLCLDTLPSKAKGLVLLTLGASGAALFAADDKVLMQSAPPVETVDTTGAGDTFVGVFLATWLNGESPAAALRYAVTAASLSTTAEGAQGRRSTAEDLLALAGEDHGVAAAEKSSARIA